VRALAAKGIETAVVTTKPYDIAHRSRWCAAHAAALDVEERPEQVVEVLDRWRDTFAGWALLPANDGALAALALHHERLSSTFRVAASPWDITRTLLDKQSLGEAARAVGLDLPHCYGPAVPATTTLDGLRYPVIVKPNVGHLFFSRFGCKLFVAHDRSELETSIVRLTEAEMEGQVLDLVPGGDTAIYAYCTYVDARGNPCGGVTIRKVRQSPPLFGVSRVAEIVDDEPELRDATIAVARHVGHHGAIVAEFKRDARDGRFRFIEINARSVIYNALLRRAGLDLAALAWSDHVARRPVATQPTNWRGVWIHLHSDILYSLLYDRLGAAELFAPYRRPKVYAVWSGADPLPFAAEWAYTARVGADALRNGSLGDLFADRARPTHVR
jgi:predicted ATP-grasp superfamily ATP-dependent carboligase